MDRKRCINCWHGRDGDCKLYSSQCATAVFNRADDPPHWMNVREGLTEAVRIFGKRKEVEDGVQS